MEQQALQLYSTLFNPNVHKDFGYYKAFYSTFVHTNGLKALLDANLSHNDYVNDEFIINLLNYGIDFFKDAIEYSEVEGSEPTGNSQSSGDIKGNGDIKPLPVEEDDITDLKQSDPGDADASTDVKDLSNDSKSIQSDGANSPIFKNIDEELRLQLILNILRIIRTILNCIHVGGKANSGFDRKRSEGNEQKQQDQPQSHPPQEPQGSHESNESTLELSHDIGDSISKSSKPIPQKTIDYHSLFTTIQWFLNKLVLSLELPEVHQTSLSITKEIIFFVYDYLMAIKSQGITALITFNKDFPNYIELFVDLLFKTCPDYSDEENITPATIRLSLESTIRIFYILGLLNTCGDDDHDHNGYQYDLNGSKYHQIKYQTLTILKFNLKYSHNYTNDLFDTQVMGESFFNWFTGNLLNFSNEYLNNKFINNKLIENSKELVHIKELKDIFDYRVREFHQLELDNFELLELLPINLYLYNLMNHLNNFMDLFMDNSDYGNNDFINTWCCLVSYLLMYQYKSKQSISNTRVCLMMISMIIALENIKELTINELDWKLCRQRSPIIPLNKSDNDQKPLLSYILDDLLILIRFNLNRKLNVDNFINAIKLIHVINHKSIDENYHYNELFKSCVKLLTFNHKYIHNSGLLQQILLLLEHGLLINGTIKCDILYELLVSFDVVNTIDLSQFEVLNLIKGLDYCKQKFDLFNDDNTKIGVMDLDADSPELLSVIDSFKPEVKEKLLVPNVEFNLNEVIINI